MKVAYYSDYFLNEDDFGKVHAEGDHVVHVAKVTNRDLTSILAFNSTSNTAFATVQRDLTESPSNYTKHAPKMPKSCRNPRGRGNVQLHIH
jgi:hypothetical protein